MNVISDKEKDSDRKKKYTVRSFYIGNELLEMLEQRSKESNDTVNSILNKMLRRIEINMQIKDYSHIITIPDHLLAFFMKMRGEALIDYARKKGCVAFKESFMMSNAEKSLRKYLEFVKDAYCGECNWAKYSERTSKDQLIITLTHGRGENWSRFMKEYLYAGLKSVIGQETISENAFSVIETGLLVSLPRLLIGSSSKYQGA
jgi:hypothetical protein